MATIACILFAAWFIYGAFHPSEGQTFGQTALYVTLATIMLFAGLFALAAGA